MFSNRRVLITGANGMIARSLTNVLLEKYPNVKITLTDIIDIQDNRITRRIPADLRYFDECIDLCSGQDYVFNLAGMKGSPKRILEEPATFFVPVLQFNTNMMEAARLAKVKWYLYTSTVGIYSPALLLKEDDVWSTFPSKNDWFSGWAKRMGELQAQTYEIQYGLKNISIIRPTNIYGPYDNFNLETCMVIPSLVKKFVDSNNPIEIWGDGTAIRDFLYTDDVAHAMLFAVENSLTEPINIGSGKGISIKELVDIISKYTNYTGKIVWNTDKPTGDKIRLMDISRIRSYGFNHFTSLEEGIQRTIKWYTINRDKINK